MVETWRSRPPQLLKVAWWTNSDLPTSFMSPQGGVAERARVRVHLALAAGDWGEEIEEGDDTWGPYVSEMEKMMWQG